jgi:hypothetical protein
MGETPDVANDFDAWAHVAALVRQRSVEERVTLLRDLGIDHATWRELNEDWARLLNEDIAAGRMDRPRRYAQICRDELARRMRLASAR